MTDHESRSQSILDRLFGSGSKGLRPETNCLPRLEACSVAIASGKGGTGKSFVATSLAVSLSRRSRVTLVDCDFGLACDHLLLGVRPKYTLQHLVSGQLAIQDIRVKTKFGPSLVPGGSGIRQMANLTGSELLSIGNSLSELAAEEDVILLDVGAGITPQEILVLLAADHVIIVTQPEIAALTDAYAMVKCLTQQHDQKSISVVVNRVLSPGDGRETYEKLSEVARRFAGIELHYLGEVLDDPAVTQRRLGQAPLVVSNPKCATSVAIHKIMSRLARAAGPLEPRTCGHRGGLKERFIRYLRRLN